MVGTSAYSKVNRTMILDIKEDMSKGYDCVTKSLDEIKGDIKTLFNHQSSRLTKGTTVLISILVGICCTLLGSAGTFILAVKMAA